MLTKLAAGWRAKLDFVLKEQTTVFRVGLHRRPASAPTVCLREECHAKNDSDGRCVGGDHGGAVLCVGRRRPGYDAEYSIRSSRRAGANESDRIGRPLLSSVSRMCAGLPAGLLRRRLLRVFGLSWLLRRLSRLLRRI